MLVEERKALLRKACRDLVRRMEHPVSTLHASARAQEHFLASFPPRPGMSLALYNSIRGEVGTERIREAYLAAGATLYYPRVAGKGALAFYPHWNGDEWEKGPYGIFEPSRLRGRLPRTGGFDLVLVPGVAFDRKGGRLGHGFGYYDRFLGGLAESVSLVGLAYSHQVVREVPVDEWDVFVHALVTEEGVIRFRSTAGSPDK